MKGRLTKDKFGFSMPISKNAPLYTRHPWHYRDVRRLTVVYETRMDPVLDMLPDNFEPATDPPQVVATVTDVGLHIPLGPYAESYVAVRALFKGKPVRFLVLMWVNSDAAMAAGREMYGAPKKLGEVSLSNSRYYTEIMQGIIERPQGTRLMTVSALLTAQADISEMGGEPAVLLKVIPDPCNEEVPAIAELYRIDSSYEISKASDGHLELYKGIGSVSFDARLETDPVYKLEPLEVLSTFYVKMHIREEKVTRLHKY